MGTSKSTDAGGVWEAGVRIFSGRPDPSWSITDELASDIIQIWESLPPAAGRIAAPPPLGYRGIWLRSPQGIEWLAYAGNVTRIADSSETRVDIERKIENGLVDSAPLGLLPPTARQSMQ